MDYFDLPKIVSVILAFFIGSLLGGIVRITEGKMVAGVLRIVSFFLFVGFVINIIDLVLIATSGKMLRVIEQ
jgi:TM2 domain-containing membrane protein YozV